MRHRETRITDEVLARALCAVIESDDPKKTHAFLQLVALEGIYPTRETSR